MKKHILFISTAALALTCFNFAAQADDFGARFARTEPPALGGARDTALANRLQAIQPAAGGDAGLEAYEREPALQQNHPQAAAQPAPAPAFPLASDTEAAATQAPAAEPISSPSMALSHTDAASADGRSGTPVYSADPSAQEINESDLIAHDKGMSAEDSGAASYRLQDVPAN